MAYSNRGTAYVRKGQYDEALADFSRALEINPKVPQTYYNRGVAYQLQGRYDEAVADFNSALKINPRHAASHFNRGVALEKAGRIREAVEAYKQSIQYARPEYALFIEAARKKLVELESRH